MTLVLVVLVVCAVLGALVLIAHLRLWLHRHQRPREVLTRPWWHDSTPGDAEEDYRVP